MDTAARGVVAELDLLNRLRLRAVVGGRREVDDVHAGHLGADEAPLSRVALRIGDGQVVQIGVPVGSVDLDRARAVQAVHGDLVHRRGRRVTRRNVHGLRRIRRHDDSGVGGVVLVVVAPVVQIHAAVGILPPPAAFVQEHPAMPVRVEPPVAVVVVAGPEVGVAEVEAPPVVAELVVVVADVPAVPVMPMVAVVVVVPVVLNAVDVSADVRAVELTDVVAARRDRAAMVVLQRLLRQVLAVAARRRRHGMTVAVMSRVDPVRRIDRLR